MDWHWQQLATALTTRQAHVRDTPPARGPTRTGPVLLPSPRPRWEVTVLGLDSYATCPTGRPTQRGRDGTRVSTSDPRGARARREQAPHRGLFGPGSCQQHLLGHDPNSITGNVHTAHNRGEITDRNGKPRPNTLPHKRSILHEEPGANKHSPSPPAGSEIFIGHLCAVTSRPARLAPILFEIGVPAVVDCEGK